MGKMRELILDYENCCNTFNDDGLDVFVELLNVREGLDMLAPVDKNYIVTVLVDKGYCTKQNAYDLVYSNLDPMFVQYWLDQPAEYNHCICGASHTSFNNEHSDWCTALQPIFCPDCNGCVVPCGRTKG